MRKTSAFIVLLLAGCATAPQPQSQPQPQPQPRAEARQPVIRLAPGIASVTIPDSARWVTVQPARMKIVNGACETNDPMPTGLYGGSILPPSLPMPNAQTTRPLAYIPNACPVTAGPLAQQSLPATYVPGHKVIPVPRPEPEDQP